MRNGKYEFWKTPFNITGKMVFRGTCDEAIAFMKKTYKHEKISKRTSVKTIAEIVDGTFDLFVDGSQICPKAAMPIYIKRAEIIKSEEK